MRIAVPADLSLTRGGGRWVEEGSEHREEGAVDLAEMSAPAVIPKVHPEQVVQDILISTLQKVQKKSSPEVSRAAAKYLALIKAGLL